MPPKGRHLTLVSQGIPDPWSYYSYIGGAELYSRKNAKKHLNRLFHRKYTKNGLNQGSCFCCEKKYLFGCPDKCETNSFSCSCKHCHSRESISSDSTEQCKCVEILRNRMLKHANLKRQKKKPISKRSSESSDSLPDESASKDERNSEKLTPACVCFKNFKILNDSSESEKSICICEKPIKPIHLNKKSQLCFCPYITNFCPKRTHFKTKGNKKSDPVKSASKLVQAELHPEKLSKTVQTENPVPKPPPKCACNDKCLRCNIARCKTPWLKVGCSTSHPVLNFCIPSSCSQNSAFVCPYSSGDHGVACKPYKHSSKKLRKKQLKERENEEESYSYLKSKVDGPYATTNHNNQKESREESVQFHKDYLNSNKNIYHCSTFPKTFDRFKCLPDNKFKYYSDQPKMSSSVLNDKLFHGLPNYYKENTSFYVQRPSVTQLEEFNTLSQLKPVNFESFMENKVSGKDYLQYLSNKRFSCLNQFPKERKTQKKEGQTKEKHIKKTIQSDEFTTYGFSNKREDSAKTMKKRRRLLVNRKRRKKLAKSGKNSFLEYQAFLSKMRKEPALVSKQIQVQETAQDYLPPKKGYFSPSDFSNLCESRNFTFGSSATGSQNIVSAAWKSMEKENSQRPLSKFVGIENSEESLKQPVRSELQLNGILEKISHNSGSTWSSYTLRNIVNELLVEKKSYDLKKKPEDSQNKS